MHGAWAQGAAARHSLFDADRPTAPLVLILLSSNFLFLLFFPPCLPFFSSSLAVPLHAQRLVCNGMALSNDESTLYACGVRDQGTLFLVLRLTCSCGGKLYPPPAMVEQKGPFVRRLAKEMNDLSMKPGVRILAQNPQVSFMPTTSTMIRKTKEKKRKKRRGDIFVVVALFFLPNYNISATRAGGWFSPLESSCHNCLPIIGITIWSLW
jgi:hypothetical protein